MKAEFKGWVHVHAESVVKSPEAPWTVIWSYKCETGEWIPVKEVQFETDFELSPDTVIQEAVAAIDKELQKTYSEAEVAVSELKDRKANLLALAYSEPA